MRSPTTSVLAILLPLLFAGCSGVISAPGAAESSAIGRVQSYVDAHGKFHPQWAYPAVLAPQNRVELRATALGTKFSLDAKKRAAQGGIYGSTFYLSVINGYPHKNTANGPPTCSLTGSYINGFAVDGKGDLIDPDGGTRNIIVYRGPGMCGTELGSISDPYGQPADAASNDAATNTIVVGNIFGNEGITRAQYGGISVCTLSAGCTAYLTNPDMYEVAGVALANNGDCWADATDSVGTATLTYFKGCTSSGRPATGFSNSYYGGLDIDASGNLVTIDAFAPAIRVYSGCDPNCTLVGGPFPLLADCVFGHLNKQSMTFACADYALGQVDVYYYSPTSLTYWYSFNNGLPVSDDVEGAAYNPRSKQ